MTSYPVRSFAYGEISKAFAGRTDAPFYHQSCRLMENCLPLSYGPAEKRPGTIRVANAKTAALFDRGDCESATAPMVAGESTPLLGGYETWARDAVQKHAGTYSYKLTKTVDAGFIDRGNCESTTAPMTAGETVPLLTNVT
jgi:hypothetical protein